MPSDEQAKQSESHLSPHSGATKFTESEKHLLVGKYKDKPQLWDVKSADYKNRDRKVAAYSDIAREMGKTVQAVKAQINVLRTQYGNVHKKVNKRRPTGSEGDPKPKPDWWLYEELSFLSDTVQPRSTISNVRP